tara:strand:- start:346 stop:537 length:192 start_codon:yes stop_codon:yes gene_type:complete
MSEEIKKIKRKKKPLGGSKDHPDNMDTTKWWGDKLKKMVGGALAPDLAKRKKKNDDAIKEGGG